MPSNRLAIDASINDKISGPLDKMRDKFDQLGKSKGAKAVLQGVGMGAGIKAFGLLESAVGGVSDALHGAIEGAMEDEKISARLDAALKANVKGWDGNREALDKYIDSQVKFGFHDEEIAASMAQLITATGDVAKAQQFQAAAMDLARLKGVSLAEATDALTKVEAGSFRVLKSLGIELKDGATATEALAAVQKAAGGQALAFNKTAAGSFAALDARIDQASDRIGAKLLPKLADAADAIGLVFDLLDNPHPGQSLIDQTRAWLAQGVAVDDLNRSLKGLKEQKAALDQVFGMEAAKRDLQTVIDLVEENANSALPGLATAFTDTGGKAQWAADKIASTVKPLKDVKTQIKGVGDAADKATPKMEDFLDAVFGPAQLQGEKAGKVLEISDLKKEIDKIQDQKVISTADKLKLKELRGQLSGAREDLIKLDAKLAALGDAPSKKDLQKFLDARRRQTQGWNLDLQESFDLLAAIAGTGGTSHTPSKHPKAHGEGGWVGLDGPEIGILGDKGPEFILSGDMLRHGGGPGGGSPVVLNIQVDKYTLARVVDERLYYDYSRSSPSAVRK